MASELVAIHAETAMAAALQNKMAMTAAQAAPAVSAVAADNTRHPHNKCGRCGERGHNKSTCSSKKRKATQQQQCEEQEMMAEEQGAAAAVPRIAGEQAVGARGCFRADETQKRGQCNRMGHKPQCQCHLRSVREEHAVVIRELSAIHSLAALENEHVGRDADGDWIYTTYKEWTTPAEIAQELQIDVNTLLEVCGV